MRVTASNVQQHSSGTLLRAYDGMSRFESDDISEEVEVLELQASVSRELERRGWEHDEVDRDWSISVNAGVLA
jgi:hypothetical protein